MKKSFLIYLIALLIVAGVFGYVVFSQDKTNVNNKEDVNNIKESENSNINKTLTSNETYFNKILGFKVTLPELINSWQENEGILSSGQKENYVTFLLKNTAGSEYFLEDPFWVTVHVLDSQKKTAIQWAESSINGPRVMEGYGVLSEIVESKIFEINNIKCIKQIEKSGKDTTTSAYRKIVYCITNDKLFVIEGYSATKENFTPFNKVYDEFIDKFYFL